MLCRMVEFLGPCWSQKWQIGILALQPLGANAHGYTQIVVSLIVSTPLYFLTCTQRRVNLAPAVVKQSSCEKSKDKYICMTRWIVIYWRLEEEDWSRVQQSFMVVKHSSVSGRDSTPRGFGPSSDAFVKLQITHRLCFFLLANCVYKV